MKNKVVNAFFVLGFYIWVKSTLLPLLLIVDIIGKSLLSEVIYFIFDYGLLVLALLSSSCIFLFGKYNAYIQKLREHLPNLENYFIFVGWIPLVLLISKQFVMYSIHAFIISIIGASIVDKNLGTAQKILFILALSMLLIFAILGNLFYDFD